MATLFGAHLHTFPSGLIQTDPLLKENEVLAKLQASNGKSARLDFNWSVHQPAQPLANSFNANSASLSAAAYSQYLNDRGYGTSPDRMAWVFQKMDQAENNNISAILNFGVIPTWAQGAGGANSIASPASVGQFLADFIAYASRQTGGIGVLEKMTGFQVLNEVNNIYGPAGSGLLPYNDYFAIVQNTITLVNQAFAAINWSGVSGLEAPDVIAPSLGGVYDPGFLGALAQYNQANGQIALQAIAIHPYGIRIDAWLDPLGGSPPLTANVVNNLTYHRIVLPTDDRLTWEAMVERDQLDAGVNYNLFTYASQGNNADEYFDRNAELGTERAMVRYSQMGYTNLEVNFTEWGASTYVGGTDPQPGWQLLWNTTFADPFKYGYIPANQLMTQAVAENLQAETVMQTVGLIESWDFVSTATTYEMFDQGGTGYQVQFGLAYSALNTNGTPNYKPAGLAYVAFMGGSEYHQTDISGTANNIGVDIHIAAAGVAGAFNNGARDVTAHELILLREGDDTLSAGAGDDVVFGGAGNDSITGDAGWDKLYGGAGNDVLGGGANADRLKGDSGDDLLTGGAGKDQFVFSSYAASGSGNSGSDTITDFNIAEDKLSIVGGYSAATLLNNTSFPNLIQNMGSGVRIYFADNGSSVFLHGITEAQLTAANFKVLEADTTVGVAPTAVGTINGTAAADTLTGTANADNINGLALNDQLNGNAGDDKLDGGTGNDAMSGGLGNDLFIVDATLDTVTEAAGQGFDTVSASVTYTLSANVENLTLTGTASVSATGNGLANVIIGNSGDNFVSGLAGADILDGGSAGFDTADYFGSGSGVTINLATGTASGGDAAGDTLISIEAVGGSNTGNDNITGSTGFNNLWGNGGNDTLNGGAGTDGIGGGAGADILTGGLDRDRFVFDPGSSGQTATTLDTITDYTKGAVGVGDWFDFSAVMTIGGSNAAATATEALINQTTSVASFAGGSGTTLTDAVADVATRLNTGNSSGDFACFRVSASGNFYVFISDGVNGVTANDTLIQLTSITSIGSINLTSGDLTILT